MPAPTPPGAVAQIRELRYMDGLSCPVVAQLLGMNRSTVNRLAPGKPGKVLNDRVRALFEASPMSSVDVARALGWERRGGFGVMAADGALVMRTLGLKSEVSRGYSTRRRWIDAETAGDLAEAMGHARWEALPDDRHA